MRPFLKWAGGKFRIVDRIRRRLPPAERLIEPFCGSAAVFLNTDYPAYLLADVNQDLITLYQTLQNEGTSFIRYAQLLFIPANNTSEAYYQLRAEFNETADRLRKSALFIYLNRHGYNGLCRYNSKGQFNVPFGRYVRPYFPEQELFAFHQKSQLATFVCNDFREVMRDAGEGDVVYCDPPYVPLSETANFTGYSAEGFGKAEQQALASAAMELAGRGVPVLISNHVSEFTEAAYQSASIERFDVRRFISCDGNNRATALEMLALFEGVKVDG